MGIRCWTFHRSPDQTQLQSSSSLSLFSHADESDDESDSYAAASPPPKACRVMASICLAEAEWRLRGGPRRSKSVLAVTSTPTTPLVAAEAGATTEPPMPMPPPPPPPPPRVSPLPPPLLSPGSSLAEIRSNMGREPRRALGSRDATAVAAERVGFAVLPVVAALVGVLGDRRDLPLLPLLLVFVPAIPSSRLEEDPHPPSL
mmetsp:Transcript_17095/g.49076  ORF Transcript_17095/g.49076 Transcript_17095/m.49076 type:complete len:202 (+) Transcript_17095:101-706(+)